jgi:hypothetical protein
LARDVQTLRANSHVQLTEASVMTREGKPKFGTYDRTNYKLSRREAVARWLYRNFATVESGSEPDPRNDWLTLDKPAKAFWLNKADHVVELMRRHAEGANPPAAEEQPLSPDDDSPSHTRPGV